jgi:hypothetical protein
VFERRVVEALFRRKSEMSHECAIQL